MTSRVDLVSIGSATPWPGGGGTDLVATGITVPSPDMQGLVARVAGRTTAVFAASRLPAGTAGSTTDGVSLQELGVSSPFGGATYRLAVSGDRELLVAANGVPRTSTVELWHLEPHDVGLTDLHASVLARMLPTPTEATRGYKVIQSVDGETFRLVEDTGGGRDTPLSVSGTYANLSAYKARYKDRSTGQDEAITRALQTATEFIESRYGAHRTFFDAGEEARIYQSDPCLPDILEVDDFRAGAGWTLAASYDADDWNDVDVVQADYMAGPIRRRGLTLDLPSEQLEVRRDPHSAPTYFSACPYWRLTATYGWAAVPSAIEQACLEIAALVMAQGPRATRQVVVGPTGESIQASPAALAVIDALPRVYRRVNSGDLFR
ncbi:MAG: hypothetical protein OXG72_16645 [Acidobacteria bacterium]|nr:hypothetical protein [Acidobacteriota bacterium]